MMDLSKINICSHNGETTPKQHNEKEVDPRRREADFPAPSPLLCDINDKCFQ